MLSLFENYKNEGKISEALLVGRNLFNRNSDNQEIFSAYFSFLCSLAETLPSLEDRKNFAEQANVALAFYAENAILTSESVDILTAYQIKIADILYEIDKCDAQKAENSKSEIKRNNSMLLKKLYSIKYSLQNTMTQKDFDSAMDQIAEIDNSINKNLLSAEQNTIYNSLTKDLSELIAERMRQLEYSKNVEYNKQAANEFASAFNKFIKNENKYKNQTELYNLVSKTLFAFDASRLFNETLIYYNHVYSYIFGKLDNDGKLAMTRYSIECEKKLR